MQPWLVDTPLGPCRLTVSAADAPRAVLLLGHGAGGGVEAFDLVALAQALPRRGITVIRHEQPWRVAGKKTVARPDVVDLGWRPALDAVVAAYPTLPLWVGGRSAGARGACRNFDERQAGVVCLSFPLHPPGRPEVSRIAELAGVTGPVLVIQGERDPFGSPQDVRDAASGAGGAQPTVLAMPGTHSFTRRAAVRDGIVSAVSDFIGTSWATFVPARGWGHQGDGVEFRPNVGDVPARAAFDLGVGRKSTPSPFRPADRCGTKVSPVPRPPTWWIWAGVRPWMRWWLPTRRCPCG